MNLSAHAHELAEIRQLYLDFSTRVGYIPNLLILSPNVAQDLLNCNKILEMRVVVDDAARVDFQVAYTS